MRRDIRYRLDAPALFSWESAEGKRFEGKGITRDMSAFGAFILTPKCPPIDAPIQLEVVLPSLPGMKTVIRLSGEARVLRVVQISKDEGQSGFAVVSGDFSRWSLTTDQEESMFAYAENTESFGRNGH